MRIIESFLVSIFNTLFQSFGVRSCLSLWAVSSIHLAWSFSVKNRVQFSSLRGRRSFSSTARSLPVFIKMFIHWKKRVEKKLTFSNCAELVIFLYLFFAIFWCLRKKEQFLKNYDFPDNFITITILITFRFIFKDDTKFYLTNDPRLKRKCRENKPSMKSMGEMHRVFYLLCRAKRSRFYFIKRINLTQD